MHILTYIEARGPAVFCNKNAPVAVIPAKKEPGNATEIFPYTEETR